MRWFYLSIVAAFLLCTLIFVIQNREIVSMDFLNFSLRTPLAIMAAVFYLLGAATGGSLFALLRRSVLRSRSQLAGDVGTHGRWT
jgi:uncharacterized integral membrane protein